MNKIQPLWVPLFSETRFNLPQNLLLCLLIIFLFPAITQAEDYIVGPGDVLKITVYDHDDLQTTVRVTENGHIIMPLLGQVKVGEKKTTDISEEITRLLADGYIINPQVNVFIEEFRSKKAVILGHIMQPGIVELRQSTTFLEIISKRGGLKDGAGDTASIKRTTTGQQEVILIDLNALLGKGDMSQDIPVHDGDSIYIPKGGMCYVTGEVQKPDAYPCSNVTILKIITLAGGFTGKASKSGVNIIRMENGTKTVLEDVDLDTPLTTDDIIVVPESFF